eukprot:385442_1
MTPIPDGNINISNNNNRNNNFANAVLNLIDNEYINTDAKCDNYIDNNEDKMENNNEKRYSASMSSIYSSLDVNNSNKKNKFALGASVLHSLNEEKEQTHTHNSDDEIETPQPKSPHGHGHAQGDFVDLILRDINNLVVIGVIESYNSMSKLADVRILPSKSHNRGNMLERFVESTDLRFKGLCINDLAVLRYNRNELDYPRGFDLDFDNLIEDKLFDEYIVREWENNINKPTPFELFDGLKVRLKEVNPSGMIIVTILPSTRAQKYLLQQISIKIDIIHIMSLNDFHQKRQSNGITNDTSRQDS